jgi:hypothetical protein
MARQVDNNDTPLLLPQLLLQLLLLLLLRGCDAAGEVSPPAPPGVPRGVSGWWVARQQLRAQLCRAGAAGSASQLPPAPGLPPPAQTLRPLAAACCSVVWGRAAVACCPATSASGVLNQLMVAMMEWRLRASHATHHTPTHATRL